MQKQKNPKKTKQQKTKKTTSIQEEKGDIVYITYAKTHWRADYRNWDLLKPEQKMQATSHQLPCSFLGPGKKLLISQQSLYVASVLSNVLPAAPACPLCPERSIIKMDEIF